MPSLSKEELQTYRATCRRRAEDERHRQHETRQAGVAAARRVAAHLREAFAPERIVLFGSLAREEVLSPHSDIDLAVEGLPPDEYYRAVAQAQRAAGEWTVDLVRFDSCPSSLRNRIEAEGQPIREEDPGNRFCPPGERSPSHSDRDLDALGRIGMTAAYRAVAGRIRQDLDDVKQVADRAETAWERYETTGDAHYLDSVALNLHDVYVGCERLFEDIARRIDESVPDGPHWHQELLDQMSSTIPNTRPPVLSSDTRRQLERYQGFRHVVRNVYAAEFDDDQIEPLIRRLPAVCDAVTTELATFADTLEQIAAD